MKYTSEYIPKLQIHQHSLLSRKVFFRHNFSALVFFSISTGSFHHLHLQVVFILNYSSSSIHHRLQVFFIFKSPSSSSLLLSHLLLQVFFITGFGSSRLLDHHCWIIITVSSSNLDHHQVWIIIIGAISEWYYLSILLVTGSSTEPALFHAGFM